MTIFVLDQNIPYPVCKWLSAALPECRVLHAYDLGLSLADDRTLFNKAQELGAVIVTYDEDFADQRLFPVGTHCGVIRLRVEPTTTEKTIAALERLFRQVNRQDLLARLTIIDEKRIRIHR